MKTSLVFGAYDAKRLVGLALAFYESGGLVFIEWVVVDPNYRGSGIAKRLVGYVERVSRSMGWHRAWCDTEMRNKEGISFFESIGYTRVATLMDWEFHENRYLWTKKL